MATVGYVRISTADQHEELQRDALEHEGCDVIFKDVISGHKDKKKELEDALSLLEEGDTLVVWRLDRLGRKLSTLSGILERLNKKKVHFRSIREGLNTDSLGGRLIYNIFASIAEYERELLIDRTKAGLKAARARGRVGGRPPKLKGEDTIALLELVDDGSLSVRDALDSLGISKATYYRYRNEFFRGDGKKEGAK